MNVGCRVLAVRDGVQGAVVPTWVLYPTKAEPSPHTFGPYAIELAIDAPVTSAHMPAVVISHGKGGTPWGYRWLATYLVEHGFAVVLVEHPGSSRNDNSLDSTPQNLANRPRHITLALDAAYAALTLSDGVAIVGHSLGAYTALAVAGGHPLSLPEESPEHVAQPIEVAADPRVRRVVLLAPAIPWLMAPGALADVRVPVFARHGERDEAIPPSFVEMILRGLASDARLDYRVVPNAGHFAFWGPVPPALAKLPPAFDPPGFDRTAYQAELRDDILRFVT